LADPKGELLRGVVVNVSCVTCHCNIAVAPCLARAAKAKADILANDIANTIRFFH
jgi:hypothetical protein